MTSDFVLAQSATVTLSLWKLILIIAPFVFWAWLVSTKLDKDARFYHFNHAMWNGIQMGAAVLALAVMLLIPGTIHIFFITWPLGVLILLTPTLIYWRYRNQRVPATHRFHLSSAKLSEKFEQRKRARATVRAMIMFSDHAGQDRSVPDKDSPLHEVHMTAEDLIGPALAARATRIELAVSPKGCAIKQTVDGVAYKREPLAADMAIKFIDYIKEIAGLNVEDRRRQQVGSFSLQSPSGPIKCHAITAGRSSGQVLRIEFNREERVIKPFDSLGLLPSQLESLKSLAELEHRHGIVLLGAPTGHGLTTSMYSFLNRHDAYTSNIKTLEREIETELDGVDQVQWDPSKPEIDFATNLQSILRRDPDVVMIDEPLDHETAQVANEPGMKGPLIYVPLRAASIPEQIRQWVKLTGDVKPAVRPLRAVTNQRLLRRLCPNCRQAYQPTAEMLKKLNLPAGKVNQLYRATGKVEVKNKIEQCPICGGTGYLGQVAAFEVFMVDDEARKLLASGDLKGAIAHARRNKMVYLQEAALSKALSGETSVEEVLRVFNPPTTGGDGGGRKKTSAPAPA
jgi:type II secretory ATPase GspE/PulE/Tfp pilus assembly ATPase PilB-like protein